MFVDLFIIINIGYACKIESFLFDRLFIVKSLDSKHTVLLKISIRCSDLSSNRKD